MSEAQAAEDRLRRVEDAAFVIVVVLVAVKLCVVLADRGGFSAVLLSLGATLLPVLAANIAGFRAAARLQVQADRSRAMAEAMDRTERRLGTVDLTRPLASQDLLTIVQDVASVMRQDTEVRFELIEAG